MISRINDDLFVVEHYYTVPGDLELKTLVQHLVDKGPGFRSTAYHYEKRHARGGSVWQYVFSSRRVQL